MKSPKVTKKTIEQEINLMEIFGVDLTDDDATKQSIAQAIIDKITKRTESGVGYGGKALKSPYSEAYQKSRQFKAAGKKADEITMELTGDMVASVDVLSTAGNKVKIGITDELQVLKAYNHITGDTVPSRPWFGVSKAELQEIGDNLGLEPDSTKDLTTSAKQKLLDLLEAINNSDGAGVVSADDSGDDGE